LLRDVTLPDQITEAIEKKQVAEEEAKKMVFVLDKEKSEAERKRIEATGQADYQRIITTGITSKSLELTRIEASITIANALSKSNNTKIIMVPQGQLGPELFMNMDN